MAFGICLFGGCPDSSAQKVYSVDNRYQADVKVTVVDLEYREDIVVYKTKQMYKVKANENKGIWFFCDYKYQADLKVFFTDKEYRAGWKHNEKKHLMS